MFSLALSTIRARVGGFVGAFIALFLGAAVITASGVLLESGLRSGVNPQRYAAAAVVVGGKQGLDVLNSFAERAPLPADVADRIAKVPGVQRAVPDRSVEVTVLSRNAVQGYVHGWSSAQLAPFTLTAGRQPQAPGEVVVDSSFGLSTGDATRIAVGGVPADYRVVGLVSAVSADRQPSVFVTDEVAARVSHRLTAVGVLAEPGVDPDDLAGRITAEVADVTTYTGRDIGDVEFLDVGQARGFLTVISASLMGTVAMVVLFVVATTLGLSIQQRRRELAVLRAIAATPRQIHRMIDAEVLLVSAAGAVLGSLPGFALAGALRSAFAAVGVLPPDFQLAFSPLPAVAALLLCVLGGWAAAYFAARKLAKANPVDALGEAAVEPATLNTTRRAFGIGLLALGLLAGAVAPVVGPGMAAMGSAAGSVLLLMIGTALLGPRLMRIAVGFVTPVLNRGRVSGYLAAANTKANAHRLSSAVIPLALGVAMAAVQLFSITTTQAAAADQVEAGVTADFVVSGSSAGLSPDVVDAVRQTPTVQSALPVVRTQVLLEYRMFGEVEVESFAAQGITPQNAGTTMNLGVKSGSLDELRGDDAVALSTTAAGTVGAAVGDTVHVYLGDGTPRDLRVVAVYANGLGFGDVTAPHDLLAQHTATGFDAAVLVTATDGAALRELSTRFPGVSVLDRSTFAGAQRDRQALQSATNLIGNGLLLLYLVVAVVNTLVMATGARSREFAMLRLIGTSRGRVRRMMTLEAGIVVGAATVIGTAVAIVPLIGLSVAMTGRAMPAVDPLIYGMIVLATAVIGFAAIGFATRAATRGRPVDAVGSGA